MRQPPLVSIVTPCLNAGRFLEKTIESVLTQDYPELEYIVMDGGSTDCTLDVLERYSGQLRYFSGPDQGVADAVNRGFRLSRGSIFGWISADDVYFPGAIRKAVSHFDADPRNDAVYGKATWIDDQARTLGTYPTMIPYRKELLERECAICQPASFIRREAFESVGMLDTRLRFAFDYDLWIRLARSHSMAAATDLLAMPRMHRDNITLSQRGKALEETIAILRRHFGYVPLSWIYCYLSFRHDGRDQFFQPPRSSWRVFLSAFWTGSSYNRKHLLRYWREWVSSIAGRNGNKGIGGATQLS